MGKKEESEVVIEARNLCKSYRIYPKGNRLSGLNGFRIMMSKLLGNLSPVKPIYQIFPALGDINLTIRDGDSIGIVGKNGSGKSTLLQIIAGTLTPTSGEVTVKRKVAALLQLGSGFNPEYTGRENVELNAAILGLSGEEIKMRMQSILDFADIGIFIDQPVKTYSSGMRIRLAFGVMTAVDPDVLIIDEALSVGDVFFQTKCIRWLDTFINSGKTFICVAHDMYLIQRICRRGIVLDKGKVILDADVKSAADEYYKLHRGAGDTATSTKVNVDQGKLGYESTLPKLPLKVIERTGTRQLEIISVHSDPTLEFQRAAGEWVSVELIVVSKEDLNDVNFGIGFRDRKGLLVGGMHTFFKEDKNYSFKSGETVKISFRLKLDLNPETYLLVIGFAINHSIEEWIDLDCLWDCLRVQVGGRHIHWGMSGLKHENIHLQKIG